MREQTSERVARAIEQAIAAGEIPGCNLLVLRDGEELYYHEAGWADAAGRKPVRRDSIFRLYSMSKPVTAVAAMILLERGIISLCEPVSHYLPAFRDQVCVVEGQRVRPAREITLKDLLNMSSGLVYGSSLPDAHPAERAMQALFDTLQADLDAGVEHSTAEVAQRIAACPLKFAPDSSWQYGVSADVLGAVIEAASGVRFGDFLQRELFEPLGMVDTGFCVRSGQEHRLVTAYRRGQAPLEPYRANHLVIRNAMDHRPAFESGGAGLVSTVDDYARLATMLLQGGAYQGRRILQPATVAYMTGGRLRPHQQAAMNNWQGLEGYTYANFMRILDRPGQAVCLAQAGEYGWDGWLGCYFANLPGSRLTFLLMTQVTDAGTLPITRKVRNCILAELLSQEGAAS